MKPVVWHGDLVICGLISAAAALLYWLVPSWQSPLKAFLGFASLGFTFGYPVNVVLFPGEDDLSGLERIVLSVGLSVISIPLLGLALNYLPQGITATSSALAMLCLCALVTLAAYGRRRQVSSSAFSFSQYGSEVRRGLLFFGICSVIVATLITAATALRPPTEYSEFYVLGSEGRLDSYPRTLLAGEPFSLTFGVTNHEGEESNFTVVATDSAGLRQAATLPLLTQGQRWEGELTFRAPLTIGEEAIQFALQREFDSSFERSLRLIVNVTGAQFRPQPSGVQTPGVQTPSVAPLNNE